MELTEKEFDEILNKFKNSRCFVRDENNKIIREMEIIFLNNHYDWDKKKVDDYPPKCTWNGKDTIWDWESDILKEGGFFCLNNVLKIYSKPIKLRNTPFNYVVQIKDNEITCGSEGFKNEPAPIKNCYDTDIIEKAIQKCIDSVNKMDINPAIKHIIKNIIFDAVYVFDEDYKGFRRYKPSLEWSE